MPSTTITSCLDSKLESRARLLNSKEPGDVAERGVTFAVDAVVYEVLRKVDAATVRIVVVETGEELNYPAAEALSDPEAE